MVYTRCLALFLDVDDAWWRSGEGRDLFVRLPAPGTMEDLETGTVWMVFVRPSITANGQPRTPPYARYVSGHSDQHLLRSSERHGYTLCRLGGIRLFVDGVAQGAGDHREQSDESGVRSGTVQHDVLEMHAASSILNVGDSPQYVLVHIQRGDGGAAAWVWDRRGALPVVVEIDEDAVVVIAETEGSIFAVAEGKGDLQAAAVPDAAEDDEDRLDLLDDALPDIPGPMMRWFSLRVVSRARPRLAPSEEVALGDRVDEACLVLSLSEHQMDGGASLQRCSSEDVAELNWGLANARTHVYYNWFEAELPGDWRAEIERRPDFWRAYSDAPPVSPPWNAVVRYDPEGGPYEAMYFLARMGTPEDRADPSTWP